MFHPFPFFFFSFALRGIQWWFLGAFDHRCDEDSRESTLKAARYTLKCNSQRSVTSIALCWLGREAWKSSRVWDNKLFCLSCPAYLGVFCCHVSIYLIKISYEKTFFLWWKNYLRLIQCTKCRAFTQTKRSSWYCTALDQLLQLSLFSVLWAEQRILKKNLVAVFL